MQRRASAATGCSRAHAALASVTLNAALPAGDDRLTEGDERELQLELGDLFRDLARRGPHLPCRRSLLGTGWTLATALAAWCMALALGSIVGVIRTTPHPWLVRLGNAYVELFRNIPLLVQMFLWYFVLPELLPADHRRLAQAASQRIVLHRRGRARLLHLGARRRAGARGHPEPRRAASAWPALALGLTLPQTYGYVLLPMAYRIILPPLTSEFLNVIKNSAVALTIGLMELTARARAMQEFTFQVFEAFTAATVIYIVINIAVTFAMRWVERRVAVPGLIGAAPQAVSALRRSMFADFDFDVILRSLPYLFYDGMTFTMMLTALATVGGIFFGTLLAMMRLSGIAPLSLLAAGYVNLMRSVPLVLVIFWFYFLVPYIGQWITGAARPIQVGAFAPRSSPSRCSRRRISARSCAPASNRSRAARWRRRRRSA